MAQIGWIDFSPSHRAKVGAALDLLAPEGMVDELGLGSLRDGMANQMFPGISSIQTRARYFFIVPYILYEFQQLINSGKARGRNPSKYLEQREYEIMWDLIDQYQGQFNSGVIGIRKRKPQKIVRRPSEIYWNGLNVYQFIYTGGIPREVFLKKSLKGEFESLLSALSDTDEVKDDADAEYENVFCIKLPPPPINWKDEITLDLLPEEADFFYDQIVSRAKGKLISLLLVDEKVWSVCKSSTSFMDFTKVVQPFLPEGELKNQLILAHDFSELMYGAHLTYNCMLQKNVFGDESWEDDWENWLHNLPENMLQFHNFDIDQLLSYILHPKKTTAQFVKEWWDLVNNPVNIMNRNALVENQEFNAKRSKARLKYKKYDDVKEDKWIGLRHFDYRFLKAKGILNDIKEAPNR